LKREKGHSSLHPRRLHPHASGLKDSRGDAECAEKKAPRHLLRVSAPPREASPGARTRSVLHIYLDVEARKRSQLPPSSSGGMSLELHGTARRGRRARNGVLPRCRANPTCPAYLLRRCSGKKVTAPSIVESDTSLTCARQLDSHAAQNSALPEVPRESELVLHTYLDVAARKRSQHPPSGIFRRRVDRENALRGLA
jgi:hypothetical protein